MGLLWAVTFAATLKNALLVKVTKSVAVAGASMANVSIAMVMVVPFVAMAIVQLVVGQKDAKVAGNV